MMHNLARSLLRTEHPISTAIYFNKYDRIGNLVINTQRCSDWLFGKQDACCCEGSWLLYDIPRRMVVLTFLLLTLCISFCAVHVQKNMILRRAPARHGRDPLTSGTSKREENGYELAREECSSSFANLAFAIWYWLKVPTERMICPVCRSITLMF